MKILMGVLATAALIVVIASSPNGLHDLVVFGSVGTVFMILLLRILHKLTVKSWQPRAAQEKLPELLELPELGEPDLDGQDPSAVTRPFTAPWPLSAAPPGPCEGPGCTNKLPLDREDRWVCGVGQDDGPDQEHEFCAETCMRSWIKVTTGSNR